jgi:predicted dehydrogenase/nucleoside-diphosphate-sugar epimerase
MPMNPFPKLPTGTILRRPNVQPIRAAIVGTGFIADYHAAAIGMAEGVELVSVCDANLKSAQAFAAKWLVPGVFDSLDSMLKHEKLDSVHVLAPPDIHYRLAKTALEAGVHVFIEKPICALVEQADDLCALARNKGLYLGVTHNMLFSEAYQRLRELVRSRVLGPLSQVTINHFLELGQIRFGPFDSWMLRSPGNAFLEVGPHMISALLDLVGSPSDIVATADRKVNLPGGGVVFSRWRVRATVNSTAVDINLNLGPGFPQRGITVRGVLGSAFVDFDANTCTVDQLTPLSLDLDRYKRSRSLARQLRSQARKTLRDSILSTFKLQRRGNPYQVTFIDSIGAFYRCLLTNTPLDTRIAGDSGRDVVDCCTNIIRTAGVELAVASNAHQRSSPKSRPTVLVFGGTGFIGRELIRKLLQAGYSIRAATRGSGGVLDEFDSDRLEIVRLDLRSESELKKVMEGIEFVYHLAVAPTAKTWDEQLQNNVELTRRIGEACLAARVKRLIYTGTIDSYYAGAWTDVITERTPLDKNINRRNYYGRAKGAEEDLLMEMYRNDQLPLVIFRPGIVMGPGGIPFHFGVGRWPADGVCEVWGEGNNKLPFVLVTDVAAALVRGIQVPGIEGRSYNLVDDPILTARDYLNELQRRSGMVFRIYYRPIWRFYLTDLIRWSAKLTIRHPGRFRVPSYFDWESRTQKAIFENKRARTELDWKPASNRQRLLDEGVGGSLQAWRTACE